MKLSYRWLGELVDLGGTPPAEAARALTFHTVEIEHVEAFGAALDGVVTARTTAVRPHPSADRLRLVTVDRGDGALAEVVCGAPNVAVDQVVAFAPVGVTLPGGAAGPITLEARAIRGVDSHGMICAEDELGLGSDHDGILVLPPHTPIGRPLAEVLPTSDTVLDLANVAITHRPDLWGHQGFARELAALLGTPLTLAPRADLAEGVPSDAAPFDVTVEAPAACPRYVGVVLEGLVNGPSPLAWRRRLESVGVRSIDRLVDLTNLVLLETGQPLHAFDRAALRGGRIVVRAARPGEAFAALDGTQRELVADDLVIADAQGPLALAGVMGGAASGVGPGTTSIVLEAAHFEPGTIRRSAARHGYRTEASTRFEKGLDPEGPLDAARRFVALAREVCPDVRVVRPVTDVRARPAEVRTIRLPLSLVRRRLGLRLADAVVRSRLVALGFGVTEIGTELHVVVPSWRAGGDVRLPEDLVEEVGRLVGYESVAPLAPIATMAVRGPDARRRLERVALAQITLERGYAEVKGYSFHGAKELAALGLDPASHLAVAGLPPDRALYMAQTAVAGLLGAAARNRHAPGARALVESTRAIAPRLSRLPLEVPVIAGVVHDRDDDGGAGRTVLHLVADVRAWLARLGLPDATLEQEAPPALAEGLPAPGWWHPGRRASLKARGVHLGSLGEIPPRLAQAFDLEGRAAAFEVSLDALLEARRRPGPATYEAPLRYPVVPFDVAVVVPVDVSVDAVGAVIRSAAPEHVRAVACFDVYAGEGIPAGQRSLAFRLELFDRDRTLDGASADRLRTAVTSALAGHGWPLRGA
jgi:phenylalanyl-tRNA synthetase beta chain